MTARTIYPSLDKARKLAAEGGGKYNLIPLALELFADIKTPVQVLKILRDKGRECFLLESAQSGETWGRYTFLGFDPEESVSGRDGAITIGGRNGAETSAGSVHATLRDILDICRSPRLPALPPFTGGWVGYFSYEYFSCTEPSLKFAGNNHTGFADFELLRFNKIIAFDNLRQKIILIVNVDVENLESAYIEGVTLLKDMESLLLQPMAWSGERGKTPPLQFTASMDKEAFCKAVEKAKRHIFEGDIFQCVPSIRFSAAMYDADGVSGSGDLFEVYRNLRTINPSAYMFYIRFNDIQLAGASPETLVSVQNGTASTYPLAGTCPRVDDDEATNALVTKLLQDEKELAEHDMLVDLGRNDLGKVCRFGTVKVPEYRTIKRLSHVCHIASKVTGEVRSGVSPLDVMAAVLPAGTLSGAPKKRACEIIDEIEGRRRGPYGGAVGYFDFAGNMDFCIGIRMAVLKDGAVYVQSGAGIVADSVPEREYEECLHKAGAMMEAVGAAPNGAERSGQ
jgi:anthranilate synthase component 1